MRLSRWLTVLLIAGVLAPAVFAGGQVEQPAGEEKAQTERVTVTWMKWGSPKGVEKRRELLFNTFPELGDRYYLEPVIGGKKPKDIAQKLRLSMSANAEIGDMVSLTYPMLKEFALSGALEDLSDMYKPVWDDLLPAAKDVVTIDGKQWAGLNQIKPKLWFYRKDMFDAAGIDAGKVITTDDFIAAGKKLQAEFPDSYIWNLGPNFGSAAHYNLGMVLSGNGAKYWDEDKKEYVIESEPGIRALFEDFRKIYQAGIVAPIDDWTPDWEQGFADSTVASSLLAIWFRSSGYVAKWAPDQKGLWAVAQWPELGGAKGGSNEGGGITVVPVSAKNKEGAKEIMSLLYLSPEGSLAHYEAVPTSHPLLLSVMHSPEVRQPDPFLGESLIPAIEKALESFSLFPTTPATDKENQIMNQAFQRYVLGSEPLDKVLADAQKEMETQIGNPWELF